jgi:hypothetical protein
VPPQNEVPAGQVQVVVLALQVAPLAVGQQTPELLSMLPQKVAPAPQLPQRPEALPWLLSPRQ